MNKYIFKFKKRIINKTKFGSYCLNGIPDGCKYCVKGKKLVLFVTGICKTGCKYCPLSNLRKGTTKMWANEREFTKIDELIDETKQSNAKGAGITGGDPLVVLNKTVKYAQILKKEFPKFHIHIYLSTKLLTKDNLKRLSRVINEVRFHPQFLKDRSKFDEDIEKIKLAKLFFKKKNIGIELPIFPQRKKETFDFIKGVKNFISFVNLNEGEIGDSNFNYVLKNYRINPGGYTIKGSLAAGKWILKKCLKEEINLKVHLCTANTKNWFQYKNRLLNHDILPYGKRTKDGTVIYYAIYPKNFNKEKAKISNRINKNYFYIDTKKKRFIINPKKINRFYEYKIKKVEEFPTFDQLESDICEIN